MPDYIQLLESKLSSNQRQALNAMTDVARARGVTLFLTGGAVRDLLSGASIRDLDITVQANPLKFKKDLERVGFSITGEHEPSQTFFLRYKNEARLEISASRTETFPKPGRPEYAPAAIIDDLHRRDFTANAMALSLNEGSWGLLLDPLNGMADISARQLRLVSNYGFLEDPIRLVRAIRFLTRTGWEMEERTKTRYENAKSEGVIGHITAAQRGYELEEIAYEEEPLQIMKALEAEGWMEALSSTWSSQSVDVAGLERLHERLVQLLMGGLHPDPSAAQFRLLTAKLSPNNLTALKKLFVRKDLIEQAEALDANAKALLQQVSGKEAAKPSQLWKLMHSAKQEAVLWLFFTGKSATVQNRFDSFFAKWPEARHKIPNAVLQDMRITPEIEGYAELLDKLTFAFMDGELPNDEAVRKFAEPYSPPAPPPTVVVRKNRGVKRVVEPKSGRGKGKKGKKTAELEPAGLNVAAEESAIAQESGASLESMPEQQAAQAVEIPADKSDKNAPAGERKMAKSIESAAKASADHRLPPEKKTALTEVSAAKSKPTVKTSATQSAKASPAAKSVTAAKKSAPGPAKGAPAKKTGTTSTSKKSVSAAKNSKRSHSKAHSAAAKPLKSAAHSAPAKENPIARKKKGNSAEKAIKASGKPKEKPAGKKAASPASKRTARPAARSTGSAKSSSKSAGKKRAQKK